MAVRGDAEIEIPSYHQIMWPLIQVLIAMGGSGTIQEIVDATVRFANYTDNQQSVIHGKGPGTEIEYRLAWARTYLKAAGVLSNSSRGVWAITDYGRTLTESDIAAVRTLARAKLTAKERSEDPQEMVVVNTITVAAPSQGVEQTAIFRSTDTDAWSERLLEVLVAMDAKQFERLSQRLLRESGFTKVEVTGRSGDGGIDGTGVLRIALLSFQVLFQCKRYSGNVGAEEIRNFRGAMVGRTDKGLFITTGSFTPNAKREATRDGAPAIDLIDGEQLCGLLKDLKLGVETRQVEEVLIDPEWFSSI